MARRPEEKAEVGWWRKSKSWARQVVVQLHFRGSFVGKFLL
jgi:hypothetical protein